MTHTTEAFVVELDRLDRREQRLTGQTLATAPLDYRARVDEIKLRLESALLSDPPMLPELNVAGAHLVALVDRVVEALTVRPETGDEQTAPAEPGIDTLDGLQALYELLDDLHARYPEAGACADVMALLGKRAYALDKGHDVP